MTPRQLTHVQNSMGKMLPECRPLVPVSSRTLQCQARLKQCYQTEELWLRITPFGFEYCHTNIWRYIINFISSLGGGLYFLIWALLNSYGRNWKIHFLANENKKICFSNLMTFRVDLKGRVNKNIWGFQPNTKVDQLLNLINVWILNNKYM